MVVDPSGYRARCHSKGIKLHLNKVMDTKLYFGHKMPDNKKLEVGTLSNEQNQDMEMHNPGAESKA